MAKQVKKEEKPFIKTKQKADNSVEVIIQKSPAKTKTGVVFVWIIAGLTLLLPLASLIWVLIESAK